MSLQLPRFAKKNSLEIERETFEKTQATSLAKAINGQETAVKEKHVRSAIIGTYQERGATTFWECVHRIPLKENPIICWKFCHVLHKVLREGHEKVVRDSQRHKSMLQDHGRFWGLLKGGYGELVKFYCNLLVVKLNFHMRNPRIPGNLQIEEAQLVESVGDSDDALFQLSVEMLDYLDGILELQLEIFKTMDASRCNSMTSGGQCRLKPLIPCIQDAMLLYDYTTKILFQLHAKLDQDLLTGHRDRFLKVFRGLQLFYEKTMSLQYFKNLIEIHHLPKNPPNFLVQSELANYRPTKMTVLNSENTDMTDDSRSDTTSEHLVSLEETNGSTSPDPVAAYVEKDRHIKDLENEIERLKIEFDRLKMRATTQIQQLQFDINELKSELTEARAKLSEKEARITELMNHECTVSAEQKLLVEKADAHSKVMEDKFTKMKEMYTHLRDEHVTLLRKNATVERELTDTKKAISNQCELSVQLEELRREKAVLETNLTSKIEDKEIEVEELVKHNKEFDEQIKILQSEKQKVEELLKSELDTVNAELHTLQAIKQTLEETNEKLLKENDQCKGQVLALQSDFAESKASDVKSKDQIDILQQQITHLQKKHEENRLADINAILDFHISACESLIKTELDDLENPRTTAETGLLDYYVWRCEQVENSIQRFSSSLQNGFTSCDSVQQIVYALPGFVQEIAFLLLYGGPLTRTGSDIQKGDALLMEVKNIGVSTLELMSSIKGRESGTKINEAVDNVRTKWASLLSASKGIGSSLTHEADAAEVLDKELQAMEQAIEEASRRMQDILSHSRASHTGIKLEVHEKLIDSCSSLMNAIRNLVQKSRALQIEIVAQGRGTASAKEFYKRNNQWTEGLISAAKSVGIGAKLLLESADKAVTNHGGFEYLIASSQEIAASTIQLVVASQVRADRSSSNLSLLKQASTGVKTATAHVVATAKDCAQLIEESDDMDVTKFNPHQSKRLELEEQAEVLRLETQLEKSRRRLSALRQRHYHNFEA